MGGLTNDAVKQDPLVGRVLIHQIHSVRAFGHNVGQAHLAHHAQGRQGLLRRHSRRRRAVASDRAVGRVGGGLARGAGIQGTAEKAGGSGGIGGGRRPVGPTELSHRRGGDQGGPHGPLQGRIDLALLMKAHFPLGRMGVHIHRAVGQDQVQGGQGISFFRQQAVIGFLQGKGQQAALNPAAVDEKGHIGAVGPVQIGRTGKTGQAIAGFRV